jgi:hypothetical protein
MSTPRNISEPHRLIFLHVPKAAGTSIKRVLDLPGGGHPTWQYFAKHFPEQWRSYRKFTVVRNPWDRVVSAFAYAQMPESHWHGEGKAAHPDAETLKGKSFADCVQLLCTERAALKHESWHPQYLWMVGTQDGKLISKADEILRCEQLESDFTQLCERWQLDCGPLPQINRSERGSYRDYYDAQTQAQVAEHYKVDIGLFDYTF